MSNNQSILSKEIQGKEIQEFVSQNDFGNAAKFLLKHQKLSWPQLRQGYEFLEGVKTKSFQFPGFEIKIQYNPGRIISSSAKVDHKSINKRECFLCLKNLPKEQKGIIYKDEFIILANPYPIFPEHFTVSSLNHIPQTIFKNFRTMLHLARDLSKYYTVFYNGPRCGASAPDHLHFQACSKSVMPLESELDQIIKKYSWILLRNQNGLLYSIDDGIRKFFLLQFKKISDIEKNFKTVYTIFQKLDGTTEEPMMNLIVNYDEETWRLIIFLREKHRPSFYEKGILWSPAAVDLGGLCIFPVEKNFDMISLAHLTQGFKEIIISNETFHYIIKKIKEVI